MSKTNQIKLFIRFLKENKVYEKFIYNFDIYIKHRRLRRRKCLFSFKNYMKDTEPEYYLFDSFEWVNTPEGGCFWADMDTKWRTFLNGKRFIYDSETKIRKISQEK